eukprot:CAMPEP_0174276638 /NCGR_PEP_ID=MMETSP0439-20130205/60502_1 /TAXON_ID=0 /ORGANISM="Stereomyxa ramosa, Strain Chinc5" /LENGTH=172 /DNA_ID=CAMNT_0015368895 /DNA_START=254 /DNA_END=769 /DNA_ORIENTATION=-
MNLLLIIVSARDNINQNTLIEYFMQDSTIFDSIVEIIKQRSLRYLAYDAMFLLTLLVNFKKYETKNPYLLQLQEMSDPHFYMGVATAISVGLKKTKQQYSAKLAEANASLLSNIGGFLGGVFGGAKICEISDDEELYEWHPNNIGAVLSVFYELNYKSEGTSFMLSYFMSAW